MSTVSAVRTLVERLDYLLPRWEEEFTGSVFSPLRSEISTLRSSLDTIKKLSLTEADADARNINIPEEYKHQVADITYSIEDIAESCVLGNEVGGAASKGKLGCAFGPLSKYSCRGQYLTRVELQTQSDLKMRLQELNRVLAAAAAGGGGSGEISANTAGGSSLIIQEVGYTPENFTVGMDDEILLLLNLLTNSRQQLSTIAICGMAGAGKTTLAYSLYHHNYLRQYFDERAWLTVGQEFQVRDILERLLLCLTPRLDRDEIARIQEKDLMMNLHKKLFGKRYLIVLDDVWHTKAWEYLRHAFPDLNNGSRILITSRKENVARELTPSIHHKQLLTIEDGWKLLIKSSLGEEVVIPRRLEKIGKQIVESCHGLPLAIHAIAGRLHGTISYKHWKRMLSLVQKNETPENLVDYSFTLSYEDLPYGLRPCFLYLGCFPRDQVIPVETLYSLWVAERMTANLEDAEYYLSQLVDRRLVMVVEMEEVSGRIKSCLLHDLMHGLCLRKGKEEGFMKVPDSGRGNIRSLLTSKLAIHLNEFEENDVLLDKPQAMRIRTILFFDNDNSRPKQKWPAEFSQVKSFQRTRVLDFQGVDFRGRKLPTGIDKLVYLRYLSFRGCYLLDLPSTLSNLRFLETLDLCVRVSCVITIPNVLRKLSRLRHLYFPLAYRSDTGDKLKVAGLEKLETLENFNPSICDPNDLLQLPKLQTLTGIVNVEKLDLDNIIKCMNGIGLLRRSSLVVKSFDSYSKDRRAIAVSALECNALHALDFEGYLGKLPLRDVRFGSNFTELVFDGSEFKQNPMPVLRKLPNLRSLVLCNDAFIGTELVCDEEGFPELRNLKLASLQFLEKLEVDSIALPQLTILTIEQCDKLEMLPSELADIYTLKKLMFGSMPAEFRGKVYQLIEDFREMGNDEPIPIFY
ncbi:putative disease resistance protein [Sesamum alatum]|uniref:Disease resistance protein n=1 Tax=Sesamum alatum TaxID=300844 RepID=A0AAE2CKF3_9LAMI|nr:putative disease resistance protein [Sesamum alatum]